MRKISERKNDDILSFLNKNYILQKISIPDNVKLTYSYLEEFVKFHKHYDERFSLIVLPSNYDSYFATKNIEKCLYLYNLTIEQIKSFVIYYFDYQNTFFTSEDLFGKECNSVYIMFFTEDKERTSNLLEKFEKMKAFV